MSARLFKAGDRVLVVGDAYRNRYGLLGRRGRVRAATPSPTSLSVDVRLDAPLPTGNADFWFWPHELQRLT